MTPSELETVIEDIIVWNVPRLLSSGDEHVIKLVRLLQLAPSAIHEDNSEVETDPNGPVSLAFVGLRHALFGRQDEARSVLRALVDGSGTTRLLGLLLTAWLAEDDEALREAAACLDGADASPNLKARCWMRLAIWAKDLGAVEVARKYFRMAARLARGELRAAITGQGEWFGEPRRIHFRRFRSDTVLFPWITAAAAYPAERALEESVLARARSIGSRRIVLGSTVGRETQAALLQAEWAGAHWLLPDLRRAHAALLLTSREDDATTRVAEALGLWLRGAGAEPAGVIDAFEGQFDTATAHSLLVDELKEGARLRSEADWYRACGALWDQLPERVGRALVEGMPLLPEWASVYPHGAVSDSLSLFAVLAAVYPDAWSRRFRRCAPAVQDVVLRSMDPSVVVRLPLATRLTAAKAALDPATADARDEGWSSVGWTTISAAVDASAPNDDLRERLRSALPASAVPAVALRFPALVDPPRVEERLRELVTLLENDVDDAHSGRFSGRAVDPAFDAARCAIALGQVPPALARALVATASDPATSPDQVTSALRAMRELIDRSLLSPARAESVLEPRNNVRSHSFWGGAADLRVESVARAELAYRLNGAELATIIAAGRDPDRRVRFSGVGAVTRLARARSSPALDSALVGALYDPEPQIQALGASSVIAGAVSDTALQDVCWARLVEMWPASHRTVRVAIASELATGPAERHSTAEQLLQRAATDRSAAVRLAASIPSAPVTG